MYGEQEDILFRNGADGGAVVEVRLPLQQQNTFREMNAGTTQHKMEENVDGKDARSR
ncbi:hypothetical protein D3C80_2051340 [compost metagenome]